MRIGATITNVGSLPTRIGIGVAAELLENAGFESLWCADHIVMPMTIDSRYPFTKDGVVPWRMESDWFEPIVTMTAIATATRHCEVGTAVLVAALREPLLLAKQLASLDAISKGRIVVGLGAGWLAEEFSALNIDFSTRGARLDELLELLPKLWEGRCEPATDGFYSIPSIVNCFPTPHRRPPLLVGGMSEAALRRAGRLGDGWYALQPADAIDFDVIALGIETMHHAAMKAGRVPPERVVLSLTGSAGRPDIVAEAMRQLVDIGVTDLVVDPLGRGDGDARAYLAALKRPLERPRARKTTRHHTTLANSTTDEQIADRPNPL